jgi:hypothetical protein
MMRDVRSDRLLGSISASTPDGQQWRIRRLWVTRAAPRWRKVPAGKATAEALSVPDVGGPDDLAATLAIILGAIVLAVIVIPLSRFLVFTGMAGKSSKSPWPLIRRLHAERFDPSTSEARRRRIDDPINPEA